ncbi:MAG: helix-turn-helix transcriptional regulator [Tissierellales bacterium]|jgi:transcriptional regulator with XRE-family HTH domain
MNIKLLFDNRELVGKNILNIIRDNGYTKSSFSKLTGISRPTLNKLIEGEITSFATFKTHIQKILESQEISEEYLLRYIPKNKLKDDLIIAMSENAPDHYSKGFNVQEILGILEDIIHMYEIYSN